MHSKWEECVGKAVKVSLGVALLTLSYWCWECPLKIESSLFYSLSLSLAAFSSALVSPSAVFAYSCFPWCAVAAILPVTTGCSGALYRAAWQHLGFLDITKPTPKCMDTPLLKTSFFSSFLIWFAKYSGSHTLFPFLSVSFLVIPPSFSAWETLGCTASGFKTRRFDLHEVLAYASLLLRRSQCVCMCVKRMLMWVGVGPCNQTEDDNPGGHIVWASTLSSTDGRRDKETASCRQRQKERAAIHFPTSLFNFVFDSHFTDPIATMKPAFVSIDSLTGSSSARGSLILSTCYDWTEWENNECFLAFLWILYFF